MAEGELRSIYLDHAASTPMEPAAIEAMAAASRELAGNPESVHHLGRRTLAAANDARAAVASFFEVEPAELVFFGSATEALAAAVAVTVLGSTGLVATSAIEHPRLARSVRQIAGQRLATLVSTAGDFNTEMCSAVLEDARVVIMGACNHELGTAPNLDELMQASPRAHWVVDAVQAAPWLDLRPILNDRTLFVVASSKLGGPPGVAALRIPRHFKRATGTSMPEPLSPPSWLAMIGFGAALRFRGGAGERSRTLLAARQRALALLNGLQAIAPDTVHNAGKGWVAPILNVSFPNVDALALEHALDLESVAVSRTAACQARSKSESSVLLAAFPGEPWRARSCVRWSLGWHTTDEDIVEALRRTEGPLSRLRSAKPATTNSTLLSPLALVPTPYEERTNRGH